MIKFGYKYHSKDEYQKNLNFDHYFPPCTIFQRSFNFAISFLHFLQAHFHVIVNSIQYGVLVRHQA